MSQMLIDTPFGVPSPFGYQAPCTTNPYFAPVTASPFGFPNYNQTMQTNFATPSYTYTQPITQFSGKRKHSCMDEQPTPNTVTTPSIMDRKRHRIDPTQREPCMALVLYTPPEAIIQDSLLRQEERNNQTLMDEFSLSGGEW